MSLYREDYEAAARLVEDEMFDPADERAEVLWNMALRSAARALRRAGLNAEWAPQPGDIQQGSGAR